MMRHYHAIEENSVNPNPPRADHDPRVNSSVGGMLAVVVASGASAAAVAPASTERPSMGVYELARAAASRCAARIEEFPVFRLAWSERGAPRVILPVFRLAWSERGAPRRGLALRLCQSRLQAIANLPLRAESVLPTERKVVE